MEQSIRLLVMEDDRGYAEMLCDFLKNAFRVDWAGTLAEGDAKLAEGKVDLVLLDLLLPDGSGVGLFERVREEGRGAAIVVLTGSAQMDAREFLARGAQDFLVKQGLSLSALMRTVREALFRRGPGSE